MKNLLLTLMLVLGVMGVRAQALETIRFDGKDRTMMVYVPENLPENAPLVITLHGANQSAEYQRDHTKWNIVADTAKFVVVYPNAINAFWDTSGQSDVRFIEHIMGLMQQRHNIDPSRIYLSGFSLGAMMCYHCIEHLGNKIAAFGPVSGVRFDNRAPIAPRIVPIIHTHCKGDDVFKWEGDPGHMAGGYPYIPDYVKSWAIYEGMDPKPQVIDPYPADRSNSDCDKTIYRRADSVVEVVLLSFDGAGHWHVDADAWGGVSTTKEIWDFCSRYTLNIDEVEPPVLTNVSPEDGSFDLLDEHRTFTFDFDRETSVSAAKATLTLGSKTINLVNDTEAEGNTSRRLVFSVPKSEVLADGLYHLSLDDVRLDKGVFKHTYAFEYTYGVEEVGESLNVDTIFVQDWDAMAREIGERIPTGWQRVGTLDNGTTVTLDSKAEPDNGARLKYIWDSGDITTGLYLGTGDYTACNINYGRISGETIALTPGKYVLSFNSAYWNKASERVKTTYSVLMQSKSNRGIGYDVVVDDSNVTSAGTVNEGGKNPVYSTAYHEYTFEAKKKENYILNFNIANTTRGVCIGNVMVTTCPTNADRYKGEFLRLLSRADSLYLYLTEHPEECTDQSQLSALLSVIQEYTGFTSTAPSEYTAAIQALADAIEPWAYLDQASVNTPICDAPIATDYYTIDGIKASASTKGFVIMREVYPDGSCVVKKELR